MRFPEVGGKSAPPPSRNRVKSSCVFMSMYTPAVFLIKYHDIEVDMTHYNYHIMGRMGKMGRDISAEQWYTKGRKSWHLLCLKLYER